MSYCWTREPLAYHDCMGLNGRECGGGTSECVQWERVDVSTGGKQSNTTTTIDFFTPSAVYDDRRSRPGTA